MNDTEKRLVEEQKIAIAAHGEVWYKGDRGHYTGAVDDGLVAIMMDEGIHKGKTRWTLSLESSYLRAEVERARWREEQRQFSALNKAMEPLK